MRENEPARAPGELREGPAGAGPGSLAILYRDGAVAVCVKPPGVLSEGDGMPVLLARALGQTPPLLCVHRLDRDVGGVMVYARTKAAAAALGAAVSGGALRKEYLAVVRGVPEPAEGVWRDLLFHDAARNKTYVVDRMRRGVREAELAYRVLGTADGLSLVSVELHTGRTHQIRVQFAARRFPLCGDGRYGGGSGPLALWSHTLAFPHPVTGKALCFTAPPPAAEPWTRF